MSRDLATSVLELSESALRRNLQFLRRQIGAAELCAVIKGNAYGHGIETFVPLAERCGVERFAVFSADEAQRALRVRQRADLLIMGEIADDQLDWAVEHGVAFYVFDLPRLQAATLAAAEVGRPARIHLEVETGLHRTGLEREALRQAVDWIADHAAALRVEGLCTHLAGAESVANYLRIQHQQQRFAEHCAWLSSHGHPGLTCHVACSAAAMTYPATVRDMVRFGIMMYGFWPSKETRMHFLLGQAAEGEEGTGVDPLRRVLRWRSRVSSVQSVPPGAFIGYGTSYLTTRRHRVAAVPVGYYHGFSRSLSNQGYVLIRGRRAPVVGTVNMNMILVDVTDHPVVLRGDEVVLIGRQGRQAITVASFSELTRFLNYEVLVRLPAEIPRVVVS